MSRTSQKGLPKIIQRKGNPIFLVSFSFILPFSFSAISPIIIHCSTFSFSFLPLPFSPSYCSFSDLLDMWKVLLQKTGELAKTRENVSGVLSEISEVMRQQKKTKKLAYKRVRD